MADLTPSRFTQAEWDAEGERRFGSDREKWAFVCPVCGNAMSIARARAELPQLKGSGWAPHQECIGRFIDVPAAQAHGKPCDWCAYGLFRGPVIVTMPDEKEIGVFHFADPTQEGAQHG